MNTDKKKTREFVHVNNVNPNYAKLKVTKHTTTLFMMWNDVVLRTITLKRISNVEDDWMDHFLATQNLNFNKWEISQNSFQGLKQPTFGSKDLSRSCILKDRACVEDEFLSLFAYEPSRYTKDT